MLRKQMLFAGMLLLSTAAFAQITIHQSDWRGIGATYTEYEADNVACPHGGPGGNQTWTIPAQTWDNTYPEWWVSPSSTPYGSSFPTATFASTDPAMTDFTYIHVTSNAVTLLGSATMVNDTPWVVVYPTEAVYLPLPASYNSSWTTVTRTSYEVAPGYTYTIVDSTTHTIDAWGTMTTPLTETYAALRSIDHEFLWAELNGQPAGEETDRYAYTWSAQDGRAGVRMEQPDDAPSPDPSFTTGNLYVTRYSGQLSAEPSRGPVAERLSVGQNYPNPFNPTTVLPVELQHAGEVTVSIYDETGRLVETLTQQRSAGSHSVPIDGSNWSTGTYFARVSADAQTQVRKMQLIK
jgi:hypothetical protein